MTAVLRDLPQRFLQGDPGVRVLTATTDHKRGEISIFTKTREGRQLCLLRAETHAIDVNGAPLAPYAGAHAQRLIGKQFTACHSAGGDNFPPEQSGAWFKVDFGALFEPGVTERDNGIGQVL